MDTKDSDRELLKWAAKAAGYEVVSDALASSYGGGKPTLYLSHNGPSWNPLTDDGDALRLAVKLNMLAAASANATAAPKLIIKAARSLSV